MTKKQRILVVDAGNTRIKTGVFENDTLEDLKFFENSDLKKFKQFVLNIDFDKAIIASVRSKKDTMWIKQLLPDSILFSDIKKMPLQIRYETPETLGHDRIANAIAAHHKSQTNALAIDVGTCVKFDFVDKDGNYLGGSISPGISLRYKAMNDYTGALPLVNLTDKAKTIGTSTKECMHVGVINGIQEEMNGFVKQYESQFEDLTIFVTGGDAQYFEIQSKSNIFANANLTLEGLLLTIKSTF